MRGRCRVSIRQPDVERHEASFDAETGKAGKQNEREHFWFVGPLMGEIVEIPAPGQFMKREETDVEQKHTSVRGHQIPESPAANFFFAAVEHD